MSKMSPKWVRINYPFGVNNNILCSRIWGRMLYSDLNFKSDLIFLYLYFILDLHMYVCFKSNSTPPLTICLQISEGYE